MTRLKIAIWPYALIIALISTAPATLHYKAASETRENPVRFALLPNIFFDLAQGLGYDRARGKNFIVRDCSSEEMNCLTGSFLRVAWPKKCLIVSVGLEWKANSVTSKVVNVFSKPVRHGERFVYVVKTSGVENSLYLLDDHSRLIGIVSDPRERSTIVNSATDARFVEELSEGGDLSESGFAVSYLAGLDHIFPCQPVHADQQDSPFTPDA